MLFVSYLSLLICLVDSLAWDGLFVWRLFGFCFRLWNGCDAVILRFCLWVWVIVCDCFVCLGMVVWFIWRLLFGLVGFC